ncbi:MAG: biotin/lipoyl-binding protein, partial [Bacteroidota bacterium]
MKFPLISIFILLAVALMACQSEPTPPSEPLAPKAIPVVLEKVTTTEEQIAIPMSGVLAAREEMQLGFKVGGLIQTVLVREGQTVRKGQALAKIDPLEIEAQVSQANSQLEKIKRDLARVENLYADSVATLEQVQDLRTALEVAE